MAPAKKVPALRFTQPGAPQGFSTIVGFSGVFHPQHPTPLTDLGLSEEIAGLFSSDPGCPVELTFITERQANEFRTLAANHRKAGQ
jgi:hypothetical protein